MGEQDPQRREETEQPGDGDEVFVAEPGTYDEYDQPEGPGWPKVVGTISIVWGSLSALLGACGLAFGALGANLMQGMADGEELPPSMRMDPLQIGTGVLGLLLAVLLIVAGAFTVQRKPAGRTTHLLYAVLALVSALWGIQQVIARTAQMEQWANENPDSPFAQGFDPMLNIILGAGAVVIFGMLYPIFLLIWFGAVKKKASDMGTPADTI